MASPSCDCSPLLQRKLDHVVQVAKSLIETKVIAIDGAYQKNIANVAATIVNEIYECAHIGRVSPQETAELLKPATELA